VKIGPVHQDRRVLNESEVLEYGGRVAFFQEVFGERCVRAETVELRRAGGLGGLEQVVYRERGVTLGKFDAAQYLWP
jgi:hypothetical protein